MSDEGNETQLMPQRRHIVKDSVNVCPQLLFASFHALEKEFAGRPVCESDTQGHEPRCEIIRLQNILFLPSTGDRHKPTTRTSFAIRSVLRSMGGCSEGIVGVLIRNINGIALADILEGDIHFHLSNAVAICIIRITAVTHDMDQYVLVAMQLSLVRNQIIHVFSFQRQPVTMQVKASSPDSLMSFSHASAITLMGVLTALAHAIPSPLSFSILLPKASVLNS